MTVGYSQRYPIQQVWSIVRETRNEVHAIVAKDYPHLATAAATATSELMENAFKYGQGFMEYDFIIEDGTLRISVVNGIGSAEEVTTLRDRIDIINQSDDPFALYTKRLMRLMEETEHRATQLGLYRIACECECKLSYEISDERVEVVATRAI